MDHVYHPGFGGSFGLKSVVPALVPELGYGDLDIAEGQTASNALEALILRPDGVPSEERGPLRRKLLDYCERDTLALVRLYEKLTELASSPTATPEALGVTG